MSLGKKKVKGGKMKIKIVLFSMILCLILSSSVMSQSRGTGAITGTVTDDEAVPLPGVTVTLNSDKLMGERSFVTDTNGSFRFPALPPGMYSLKAELPGFTEYVQENIRLETTIRLTFEVKLQIATLEEQVTVIAQSPTVDVKSSETASVTLSNEILRNIPFSNFAMDIVNMAPGVNNDVAYGASESTGVSYQIDGVDVSDPEAGSAWVFVDPNIIEEAKVMGIGLPAEYGNFTGVIFNLVTKSGGNEFSGHFDVTYQGKQDGWPNGFWQTDNNQDYVDDFPDMTSPIAALFDSGAHLGGPIAKDKVWFYLGLQYYRSQNWATGFPNPTDYKQPRSFLKLTSQLGGSTNLTVWAEVDSYNGINRSSGSWVSPEATIEQKSPEAVGSFSLTHILNERTFFDVKGAFFTGYYYLDPMAGDVAAHYDLNDNMRYDSAGWFYYADRDRFQSNANITHYAEDFLGGDHDFKFGAEFEYGKVRSRYGYTGPNNMYYYDYVGYGYTGNYLAYQYEGYDSKTQYTRLEEFVQDSWKVSDRLNINLGLRFTHVWGTVTGGDNPVYTNNRIAPRAGFTFDILGDRTTIFKAHYGQFTEAMLSSYHDRLNPASAYSDQIGWYWDLWDNDWVEMYRIEHEDLYSIDPDIKHPYMHQIVAGIERDLSSNMSLSATFIYRKWANIVGRIDTAANYVQVDEYVPELNKTFQIWEQTNVGDHKYVLKNIQNGDPWITIDPYRKYWGIELLFNKRFSNNWQLLASYVYSQATGSLNNGFGDDIGWGGDTDDPNFWINSDGHSTNDPTHMLKIQGTIVLPFGIHLSSYFRAITGNAWTTRYRTRLDQGRLTFLTEPRGTNHYPLQKTLDFRLEKTFTFAQKYRLGVMFDVFNLFNDSTIDDWGTRIGYDWYQEGDPDYWASTEGHELYGFARPRRARLGIRFMF